MNWNNRTNQGLAVACRRMSPREYPGDLLRDLHAAYRRARQGKKLNHDQLRFSLRWMDNILDIEDRLLKGTWQPAPTVRMAAVLPKAREILAPAFGDCVVHHWIMQHLEPAGERDFISDSYSNRKGKGTHAAVEKLTRQVRQMHSGQGGGFFLQLDIYNCFNSLNRRTTWQLVKRMMERAGVPLIVQRAVHACLRRSALDYGVIDKASPAELALIPPHKRLENAASGCGLPIGNLLSQFLVNVYLHELDLFVKHVLGAKRYVRYVDDMVLVHHDRAVLEDWQRRIETFLAYRLQLRLKDEVKFQPLTDGIDFLGYVIRPTHTTVRRRVVSHAREKLSLWERQHIAGDQARATPEQYRQVRAIWASYGLGHFPHANSHRLTQDFHRRYPWLHQLAEVPRQFHSNTEDTQVTIKLLRAA